MAASVFYIFAYATLCAAIFGFPKTARALAAQSFGAPNAAATNATAASTVATIADAPTTTQKQNAFLWFVLALFAAECWASVTSGLLSLLHIPVTLVSIGTAHLAAAAFLYILSRRRAASGKLKCAVSELRAIDLAVCVLLLTLIVFLGYTRFHTANPIIFATIDPAERLGNAMNIAVSGSVITHFPNQYFIQLTGSLFIQTLQPLAPDILPFRFFEWKDMFNLWFTGALFYCATSLYLRARFSKVFAAVLSFAFVLGYPWSNQLFGFVYPGVATNLILLILIAFALLYRQDIGRLPAYTLISLGCFGLGICYTLFVPPVFLAAFLAVFFYERKARQTPLGRLALTELAVFILPAVWTFANAVLLDYGGEFNVGNSITSEGAIYRNLFTDFIPYAPFVLWFLWRLVTKKRLEFPLLFALCFAAYQIGIFAMMMTHRVSTYYYYKLYFATWLIFLFLACLAIDALVRHARARRFVAVYFVCWALIAALGISGADYMLKSRIELANEQPGADVSFRVYATNILYFTPPGVYNVINYDWSFIELCTEARRLSGPVDEQKHIEIVTDTMKDVFWKDALTSQLLIPRELGVRPQNAAGLWVVLKTNATYTSDRAYYDSFPKLFENEQGFIIDPQSKPVQQP